MHAQVGHDSRRVLQPLRLALAVGDLQARHFGGTAALQQVVSVGAVVLSISLVDGQRQAAHFLAHLDAKRAGAELVQRHALALQIDSGLRHRLPIHATGLGQTLFE